MIGQAKFWILNEGNSSMRQKITFLLLCLALVFIIQLIFSPIFQWIKTIHEVKYTTIPVKISVYFRMVQVIVISPLIEEAAFRLPLKFSIRNLNVSVISISVLFFMRYEMLNSFLFKGDSFNIRLLLLISVSMIAIISIRSSLVSLSLSKIWKNNFWLIFSISGIAFSLIHLRRFEITSVEYYYVGVIILFYYFLMGILFSFIRLRLGIMASFGFHSLYNSTVYWYVLYFCLWSVLSPTITFFMG